MSFLLLGINENMPKGTYIGKFLVAKVKYKCNEIMKTVYVINAKKLASWNLGLLLHFEFPAAITELNSVIRLRKIVTDKDVFICEDMQQKVPRMLMAQVS